MEKYLVEELHKVGKNVPLEQQTRMAKESCSATLQLVREFEIHLGWVVLVVVNPGVCPIDLWLCSCGSSAV